MVRLHYPPFLAAVEEAEALARQRFVGQVALAARGGSWQAAAWFLERRAPGDWGRRERLDGSVRISRAVRVGPQDLEDCLADPARER